MIYWNRTYVLFWGDNMERVILHSDLNNCYANIELLHRPALRGKAVVVGGDVDARHGIVLAKSDAAKKLQIKTGMVIWQAKQICPNLVVLPPNYELYLRFAKMAREIYGEYTDQTEAFGLDESWLDITGSVGLFGDGESVANEIRQRIKNEMGVTASVGVSYNKIYAKLGSDLKKPDATTVISRANFKERVWPLPASDLLYVGPSTARKLASRAIFTIGDIAKTEPKVLKRFLGKAGEMLWIFACGHDESPVTTSGVEGMIKSVGNSSTFPRDLMDNDDVKMGFYMLAESVAARLREGGFECRVVQISVRDVDLFSFERQTKLERPTNLVAELVPVAMHLFLKNYSWQKPIRSIGIRGADLVTEGSHIQLSMFESEESREKLAALERVTDHLRERYGYFSVQRAFMLCDKKITSLDAKSDNIIHPIGYNYNG